MRVIRQFFVKVEAFLFRGRAEREMAREIDAHLALLKDDFEGRGMSPEAARLAALRAYGGVEQAQELHRDERSFVWLEQALQDLRHASRALLRAPGFTVVAVITMALGIGVNTALFSGYNAIALKPLPVFDPDQVVRFKRSSGRHRWGTFGFSYPEYVYCRDHSDQFASLVAGSWLLNTLGSLPGSAGSEKLVGQLVSSNYFQGLGIHPLIGRGFLPDEDRTPGANHVMVISFQFWKRAFNGNFQALGQTIKLNGAAFTVIGIAPEEFTGTSADAPVTPDFWAPLSMQAPFVKGQDWLTATDQPSFQILARLKPSTLLPAAEAQVDSLVRRFTVSDAERPGETPSRVWLQRPTWYPNPDGFEFQAAWVAAMLLVGLVLFVACVNVGNMLLARAASRQREIGTRLALGARRGRVIRQLLTESILLSCLAGCAGLLVSVWVTKLMLLFVRQMAQQIDAGLSSMSLNFAPDLRVLVYVLAVAVSSGILFGLSPALQFTRRDLTAALKEERGGLGSLGGSRLRSLLVAAQVAVSMFLLLSVGLVTRGLLRFQSSDLGFEARAVFVVAADFGPRGSAQGFDRRRLLAERLRDRPEFASVALGDHPLNSQGWAPPIVVGHSLDRTLAGFASDTYFRTLGISLRRGRTFTAQEAATGAPVAVISESTARRFWPNRDPLGRRFALDLIGRGKSSSKLADFEVIGIVKDVRLENPTRVDPSRVYLPTGARDNLLATRLRGNGMSDILFRFRGDPRRAQAAVEATVLAFDKDLLPSLRLINLQDNELRPQLAIPRFLAAAAGALAVLALTLAGVGIYGVIAYLVSCRTREIGIRIALGGNSGAVLKDIVLHGLRPVFAGMILGLIAAAGLSTLLHVMLVGPGTADILFGVPFYDPLTFVGLFCFVLGIAGVASAVPSKRALNVDPMTALRYE
jgi:macrolide transport system ATP-binding/permease protein